MGSGSNKNSLDVLAHFLHANANIKQILELDLAIVNQRKKEVAVHFLFQIQR